MRFTSAERRYTVALPSRSSLIAPATTCMSLCPAAAHSHAYRLSKRLPRTSLINDQARPKGPDRSPTNCVSTARPYASICWMHRSPTNGRIRRLTKRNFNARADADERQDVYQRITARIVADLEKGVTSQPRWPQVVEARPSTGISAS